MNWYMFASGVISVTGVLTGGALLSEERGRRHHEHELPPRPWSESQLMDTNPEDWASEAAAVFEREWRQQHTPQPFYAQLPTITFRGCSAVPPRGPRPDNGRTWA